MCVCAYVYLHADENLYLKLLEINSDQNAFQVHYLENDPNPWVYSRGQFSLYHVSHSYKWGGYSSALSEEETIFVFENEINIQIYSGVLALNSLSWLQIEYTITRHFM